MNSSFSRSDKLYALGIVLFAFSAAAIFLSATRMHMGVSLDAVFYINGAENIVQGNGYRIDPFYYGDMTPLYPPGFPCLLAGVSWLTGRDIPGAARLLHALAAIVNVICTAGLIWHVSKSGRRALLGAFLMASTPIFLELYTRVLSETSFVAFMLPAFWCFAIYLDNNRRRYLITGALCVGMAIMIRYLGVILLPVVGLTILLTSKRDWLYRIVDVILFGMLACAPFGFTLAWNKSKSGSATTREFIFNKIPEGRLHEGLETVSTWLLPPQMPITLRWIILIAILAYWIYLRWPNPPVTIKSLFRRLCEWRPMVMMATLLMVGLPLFIMLYIVISVQAQTMNDRVFSPMYPCLLVLICVSDWGVGRWKKALPRIMLVYALILGGAYAARTMKQLHLHHLWGVKGYLNSNWARSEMVKEIKKLPDDITIYTDSYDAIFFLTGKMTQRIPHKNPKKGWMTQEDNSEERESMELRFREGNGYVIFFDTLWWRNNTYPEQDLVERYSLIPIYESKEGTIYKPTDPVFP